MVTKTFKRNNDQISRHVGCNWTCRNDSTRIRFEDDINFCWGSGRCLASAGDGRGDGGLSTLGEVVDCF